jgi:hypothetical protein
VSTARRASARGAAIAHRASVGQLTAHHEAAHLQRKKLNQAALALVIIDYVVLPSKKTSVHF